MVVGFNHNFRYRGEVYHVQTEDGGLKSPTIVTLLYRGGTILFSKKTSYADITKVDSLERVVEDLMKEQHREMLRRLKNGDFDDIIKKFMRFNQSSPKAVSPAGPARPSLDAPPPPATPPQPPQRLAALDATLDEIILSYLVGEEEKEN